MITEQQKKEILESERFTTFCSHDCVNCAFFYETTSKACAISYYEVKLKEEKAKVEKLRNALGFYANWANYKKQKITAHDCEILKTYDHKDGEGLIGGKLARQTIKELE